MPEHWVWSKAQRKDPAGKEKCWSTSVMPRCFCTGLHTREDSSTLGWLQAIQRSRGETQRWGPPHAAVFFQL